MPLRITGLDLLRIISMLSIVFLHILGFGGILENIQLNSSDYFIYWNINIVSYSLVNCFGLITGYFLSSSEISLYKLTKLWKKVTFYSVIITLLMVYFLKKMSILILVKSFFPILFNQYWYFTAYFIMIIIVRLFNLEFSKLSIIRMFQIVAILIIMFSILGSFSFVDSMEVKNGYSFIWLICLFMIGALIRKLIDDGRINLRKKNLITLLIVTQLVIFLFKLTVDNLTKLILGHSYGGSFLIRYNSPLILLISIIIFILFLNIQIRKEITRNFFHFLSSYCFSVYLIHANSNVLDTFFKDKFIFIARTNLFCGIFIVFLSAITIFTVCITIDFCLVNLYLKIIKNKESQ